MVTNMESHSHSCYEDGNGAKKKKSMDILNKIQSYFTQQVGKRNLRCRSLRHETQTYWDV